MESLLRLKSFPMAFKMLLIILYVIVSTQLLYAEIFTWTDENGIKHFSNTGPQSAEKFTVIPESEYKGEKTEPITKEPGKAPKTNPKESQSQPESQADVKTDNEITS